MIISVFRLETRKANKANANAVRSCPMQTKLEHESLQGNRAVKKCAWY